MQLTGAQIIIKCLKEQGVDTIFGYPGGAILNLYDELYKHSDEIRHVLTSHEQGAAHAADGYARATGKVGVCIATSGPGATNLVTGIATAYMDSVPVVAITCNVGLPLLGKDSFQEIDIAGITTALTEYIYEEQETPVRSIDKITEADLDEAVRLINESEKPYIFVGGGAVISNAEEALDEFVSKVQAPVTDSLMGKGAYDGRKPLYTGMLGMHGTKASNYGVSECDLLIAIGVRFSDRVTGNAKKFADNAKILQIDIDPAEINKNIQTDASLIGDVREVLRLLNSRVKQQNHDAWIEKITDYKKTYPMRFPAEGLSGPYLVDAIYKKTNGEAIIVTEVGQHQMWAAQFYKYAKPRTFLTSGGLGTMGYGLGAAIGAQIGRPDRQVINIAGDGCFRMNMNEIATAVREKLPLIEVVVNNHVLGMVRQWQDLFYEKRFSHTVLNDSVDFVKLAEAMGATGIRVTTREEFEAALEKALAMRTPVLLDCIINCDDKVWPMVAPGAAISEVFDEQDII